MLTTIDQFAGQDIWVYAELDEFSEDTYIRVQQVFDDEVIFNAALHSDGDDIDEILYGELTSDIDNIEIHPLDTLTTEELIAKIEAANRITSSKQFTKYPTNYIKASNGNESPEAWESMSSYDKDRYWWAGAKLISTERDGTQWFVLEDESDSDSFVFALVFVTPDGVVSRVASKYISKDTYTTEQAYEAMDSLVNQYWDRYAE